MFVNPIRNIKTTDRKVNTFSKNTLFKTEIYMEFHIYTLG